MTRSVIDLALRVLTGGLFPRRRRRLHLRIQAPEPGAIPCARVQPVVIPAAWSREPD